MKKIHPSKSDPRWYALSLVQTSRETLGLKARSITVLRGLMSFISSDKWAAGDLKLFPSNKALQERCDAMDERTLRRHLAHLCKVGLIERRLSPNRKRYVVRDENGQPTLTYGFDLSPIRHHLEQLEAMAEAARKAAKRVHVLKAILRDLLWDAGIECQQMHKLLRNKSSIESLESAIENLRSAINLTDSHGQIDRHIQNSNKEYNEEVWTGPAIQNQNLSAEECIEAATDAIDLCSVPVRQWSDLHKLAQDLAPAIGINKDTAELAQKTMGNEGATLAILGMVQSIARIKSAPNYLLSLCHKAQTGRLSLRKMFNSLTKTSRFPAGNRHIFTAS